MPIAPIQRSTSLRYLIRDITRDTKFRALQNIAQSELVAGLRPVAALAAWLSKFEPNLTFESSLTIAVVGAEQEDTVDEGRWYGLLGYLLGNEALTTRVTFVGPSLYSFSGPLSAPGPNGIWKTQAARTLALLGYEKATVHRIDAATFSRLPAAAGVDLIVMFNPGLEDDHSYSWFEPGQLSGLCELGRPIALSAYAEEEQLHEDYLLRAWGFTPGPESVLNPFTAFDTPVGTWSRHLWALKPLAPKTDSIPDREMLGRHERYMRIAENVLAETHMTMPDLTGKLIPMAVRNADENPEVQGIGLPFSPDGGDWVVGLTTGTLYAVHNGVAAPLPQFADHPVPESILSEYDSTQPYRFEHILWAVDAAGWVGGVEGQMRDRLFSDAAYRAVTDIRNKAEAFRNDRDLMSIPGADELADLVDGVAEIFGQLPSELQATLEKGSAGFPTRTPFEPTPGAEAFFHALNTENWAHATEILQVKPALALAIDGKGANAVMYATVGDQLWLLAQLAEAGADFSVQDEELFAPLHEAARRGLVDVAGFLLDHGAQPDAATRYGFTPLHMTLSGRMGARSAEDYSAIVLKLLAHRADANKASLAGLRIADFIDQVDLTDAAREALRKAVRTQV